ncbi:uncharacterized protein [Blastocystis hominis]|uniref:Uncharacterized protein n=1 Tax=Blastocystis hominis TaxID=12968 RepID=D8LXK7_BLAHO|nr:uncharacterized protein [Blastocystis hominis]CBK20312.2 unnamed protein product [Blastocystis hominis]|eukprot:XP_012894360.1 uncharacterized protein [Blastocystis hominis]
MNHAENRCYAGGADGAIYIVDLSVPLESSVLAGKEGVSSISGHSGAITACCITGDDSKVLTGGQDGRVLVWDAETMQVLREYKGSNASSKMNLGGKEDGSDKSIVFLCAIPYPTLLFDNENTLYPVRALKKYRISKIDDFEPVLCLNPIQSAEESSRFVGVAQSAEGNKAFSVVETTSKKESAEEALRKENARLKELGEQWKSIAERAFQQLITSQSKE